MTRRDRLPLLAGILLTVVGVLAVVSTEPRAVQNPVLTEAGSN